MAHNGGARFEGGSDSREGWGGNENQTFTFRERFQNRNAAWDSLNW